MMKIIMSILFFLGVIYLSGCEQRESNSTPRKDLYRIIENSRFVDLTHTFYPGIPHWQGFPDEKRETLYWYEGNRGTLGSGFWAEKYTIVGQWGTHVDPPAHFAKGLRTVDQIRVKEMVLPLVVIDIHHKVKKNPDYVVKMSDIEKWERTYGTIPKKSFVALRTDWSKRWPNIDSMRNVDKNGVNHYPGWSSQVLQYLYEVRMITASGHETTDTDPGIATSSGDYSLEAYILGKDHYQIELLTNLDKVPMYGALVIVSFPKPKKGSGFPARIIAIIPAQRFNNNG